MSFIFRDIDLPASHQLSADVQGEKLQKVFPLDYRKVPFKDNYKPPHCVLPEQ